MNSNMTQVVEVLRPRSERNPMFSIFQSRILSLGVVAPIPLMDKMVHDMRHLCTQKLVGASLIKEDGVVTFSGSTGGTCRLHHQEQRGALRRRLIKFSTQSVLQDWNASTVQLFVENLMTFGVG